MRLATPLNGIDRKAREKLPKDVDDHRANASGRGEARRFAVGLS
jgi:hypothetical protein